MSHRSGIYTTILLPVFITAGCASTHETAGGAAASSAMTACTEPRPQICTREYRPVCAQLSDGRFKTYATGCTACSDAAVSAYKAGACEADP